MEAYKFVQDYLYFSGKHISEIDSESVYDYHLIGCEDDDVDVIFTEIELKRVIDQIFDEASESCQYCFGGMGCNTCHMVGY